MTIPATQLAAWRELAPRLGKVQRRTCELLEAHGPMTRNELDARGAPGMPNAPYSRRLAELSRRKLVQRVGERRCTITHHRAEVWAVVNGPAPPEALEPDPNKPPLKAEIGSAVLELRGLLANAELSETAVKVLRWLAWRGGVAAPENDARPRATEGTIESASSPPPQGAKSCGPIFAESAPAPELPSGPWFF